MKINFPFYIHLNKKLLLILISALIFYFSDILYKYFFIGYLKKKIENEKLLCSWFDFTYQIGIFLSFLGTFFYTNENEIGEHKNDIKINNSYINNEKHIKMSSILTYKNYFEKKNIFIHQKKIFIFILIVITVLAKLSEEHIKKYSNPLNLKVFCYDGSFFTELYFIFLFIESFFLHKYFCIKNYVFYNFNNLALIIIIICFLIKLFVFLELSKNKLLNDYNGLGFCFFAFIINFLHTLMFNLIHVYVEIFLIDVHILLSMTGAIGIIFYIIYFLIYYKKKELNIFFSNPFIYLMLFNSIYQCINNILQAYIIKNFHILYFGFIFIIFKLFNSFQETNSFFENQNLSTSKMLFLKSIYILAYFLCLIAFLIFTEILQLRFCGLDKNTKINIRKRQEEEKISLESIIN